MRTTPIILLLFLSACSNSTPKKDENGVLKTDTESTSPYSDSIIPPSLKDTLGLDEYGKDSLKMCVAFQLAANKLSRAYMEKDVLTYSSFTPPEILKMYGGPEKYRSRVKELLSQDHVEFDHIISGPVKRVQAAVDNDGFAHGWYCLMPVRNYIKKDGKMEMQWLGGQTLDGGKTIYFLDITGKPKEQILQIMPDLVHFVLDQEEYQ